MAPSTTTTSWSPTASPAPTPGRATRRSPGRAASTSTSRTCAPSGTTSWPASRRSACPTPRSSTPTTSGFITTQIIRSGNDLDSGINGYESEYSHDVVGILTNLFTQGSFTDAHALLTEARNVVGAQGQYVDGLWTLSVPWAVYLLKTGDTAFVRQSFATGDAAQPSLEDAAHAIAADRTGPMGTMEATDDIDTQGYWTTDDYEALLGLAAYRYIAATLGDAGEASWASTEYASLLGATNTVLGQTISSQPPRLPALLADPAQHGQPLRQPQGRQLDLALRELGLGGLPPRRPAERARPDPDRRHLRLRVRPAARPAATGHGRRLSRRVLLERLQRGHGRGRTGQCGPPRPGDRELRVHDRQQPERSPLVVGELGPPRPQLAVGGPASRHGPGFVAPRLGHGRSQQGAAGLAGGPAVGRVTGGRPGRAARRGSPGARRSR